MKLTPRLQAVAQMIAPGSVVADIGTDHAYIPAYLLLNHLSPNVIASDNRQGPLDAAAQTLALFRLDKKADLRLGNGLEVVKPGEVDVIVLAGMGGETICSILEQGQDVLTKGIHLVIQPMTEAGLVRKWLQANEFSLLAEDIAQEEDNYYQVIAAQLTGDVEAIDLPRLEIGPCLISNRHPLLVPMLRQRLQRLYAARDKAKLSTSPAAKQRVVELEAETKALEEVLLQQ